MRRSIMIAVFATLAGAIPASAPSAQQKGIGQIASVMELYTSQGCSSCPPADQLLKSYLGRDDVLALSFNVDIWDNLGWKDTLAKPQYTQRQRSYARVRGDGQVYTPQTVINGMAHEVGSDRVAIDQAMKATEAKRKSMRVELALRGEGDGLIVDIPRWVAAGATAVQATVWLVKLAPRVEVAIKQGENSGRTIAYHNVVRDLRSVGTWMGEAKPVRVTREALTGCSPGTCAILLQQGETGSILGAAWVPGLSGT
jgi:hypothetical protein